MGGGIVYSSKTGLEGPSPENVVKSSALKTFLCILDGAHSLVFIVVVGRNLECL